MDTLRDLKRALPTWAAIVTVTTRHIILLCIPNAFVLIYLEPAVEDETKKIAD